MKKILLAVILTVFCTALFAGPKESAALVIKGNEYYKKGMLEEALKYYTAAAKEDRFNFFAYMNIGYVFAAKGDNKTALAYLEKAYSINPDKELKKGIEKIRHLVNKNYFYTDSAVKFSRKAGLNISVLNGGVFSYEAKAGLNAGFDMVFGFGRLLSWQAGLFYSQKGAQISGLNDTWINLDYIEIPASAKISFTPISEILAGFYAGGFAAVRTAARYKTGVTESERSFEFELFDFGLVFGLDFAYPLFNIFFLTADFRFYPGLADIIKDPAIETYTMVFTAAIGLIF